MSNKPLIEGYEPPKGRLVPWWQDEEKIIDAAKRIKRHHEDGRRTWTPVMEDMLLSGWRHFRSKLRDSERKATDNQISAEILTAARKIGYEMFFDMTEEQLIRKHQRLIKSKSKK